MNPPRDFDQEPEPQRHLLGYSALAFLESEILRNGGGEYDLSAMWIVRNAYFEKAVKYARMHVRSIWPSAVVRAT